MIRRSEKVLVFPFSYRCFPEVKVLIDNDHKVRVASEEGSGLLGKDIAYSVNRKHCNVTVDRYSKNLLRECDILYIPGGNHADSSDPFINEVLKTAVNFKKKIISAIDVKTPDLDLVHYDRYLSLKDEKNELFFSYFQSIKRSNLSFYTPHIPVVFVGGLFDIIDNTYIAMNLKKTFEKSGYKACCITKEVGGGLFDCLPYPDNFISNGISIEEKIIELNNYVRACEEFFKPQILIIQIPYGMIRYSKYLENSFGAYSFMVSQAVLPDYFIYSSTLGTIGAGYFKELSNYYARKIDTPINCLHLSNFQPEIPDSRTARKFDFVFKDQMEVLENIECLNEKLNFIISDLFNHKAFKHMFNDILGKLQ